MLAFKKFFRYVRILGLRRTLVKTIGRLRVGFPIWFLFFPVKSSALRIGLIGAGQFSFSTIAYFLTKYQGRCLYFVYDINSDSAKSLAKCYSVKKQIEFNELDESLKDVDLVYVASNHATHTDYAIKCLAVNTDVYIEKPISVSYNQFYRLKEAIEKSTAKVYFGYNRPFSSAISELKRQMNSSPFTLNCMVVGHYLNEDHWYRKPDEGTRICGNLGHWLDLTVHLLSTKDYGGAINIDLTYADKENFDDNISVVLTTAVGDIAILVLTSRAEPFEGISENIVFHQDDLTVNINDFRDSTVQAGPNKQTKRYLPKDVGHKNAILQPFLSNIRSNEEVYTSTLLMLHITDMVRNLETSSVYRDA